MTAKRGFAMGNAAVHAMMHGLWHSHGTYMLCVAAHAKYKMAMICQITLYFINCTVHMAIATEGWGS
jgi:hypothetical protein